MFLGMMSLGATAQSMYGDVNGDGVVNITDVNHIINIILSGGYDSSSDVNSDGQVNITDLNVIIGIILNPTVEPPVEEHEWVDLGLPSGTLWATCNVGANSPEEYGDYFAWGETSPKEVYNWNTYKWCNGSDHSMTKYCTQSDYGNNGFTDGKTELDPSDDAATANWGSGARMPSREQIEELIYQCSTQWTQFNGVYGNLITGPNGNTIFLPYPGYRWDNSLDDAGTYGYYWSRTLFANYSNGACNLIINYGYMNSYYNASRYYGFAVRAVRVS